MTTIHLEYGGERTLVPYAGAYRDLTGGECLGRHARHELLTVGDIVTLDHHHYYYDPKLLIDGESWVKVSPVGWPWVKLIRKAPAS